MTDITQLLTCIVCLLLMASSHVSSEECTQENITNCDSLYPGNRIQNPDDSPQAEQIDKLCSQIQEWINCYAKFLSSCDKASEASIRNDVGFGEYLCAEENHAAYALYNFNIDATCFSVVVEKLSQCGYTDDLPQPLDIYRLNETHRMNETCKQYETVYKCLDNLLSADCTNDFAVFSSGLFRREQTHGLVLIGCPDPRQFALKRLSPEECVQDNINNCYFLHPGGQIANPDFSPHAEQIDTFCSKVQEAINCFTKFVSSCDVETQQAEIRDEIELSGYLCAEENRAAFSLYNFDLTSTCFPVVTGNLHQCGDLTTFPKPGNIYPIVEEYLRHETCKQYDTFYKCLNNLLLSDCTNDMARFLSGMFQRLSANGLVLIGCPDPRAIGLERRSSAASLTWEAFKILAFIRIADMVVSGLFGAKIRVLFGQAN